VNAVCKTIDTTRTSSFFTEDHVELYVGIREKDKIIVNFYLENRCYF
jgi:hypothetical protein